jgi:hypothetical protein
MRAIYFLVAWNGGIRNSRSAMVMGSHTNLTTNTLALWTRDAFLPHFVAVTLGLSYCSVPATPAAAVAVWATWVVSRHFARPSLCESKAPTRRAVGGRENDKTM